ncbi:LysR family transcriptional regulator [Leeia oryzae]|uniref:LysR family transcriptional regulator n=1 Tax=Leeia oryzae TaxID=356662 RepID=UPI00036387A9|nr:LysR family transcriptional regulator [Leeia oryzae]
MSIQHRHIEVFRAIMTSGSVTEAAVLLHTSQPTISRELARLEYLLGFNLFDRLKGRLVPTARALTLFEEVQRSYIGLERIMDTATSLSRQEGGALSVVCLPAFSHALLPAVCKRLHRQLPTARVTITPQESPLLEEWLSMQRFDAGLTEHDEAPPGTRLIPLLNADEICVLPDGHPLLEKSILTPADFAGHPFVSLAVTDPYRVQLDAVFAAAGVTRQLLWETPSAVSVCALVAQGIGVSIVNPLTALAMSGQGLQLRRFLVSIPYRVSAVLPQFRPSAALTETFMQLLQAELADIRQRLDVL